MSKILRLSPLFEVLKDYETREGLILMIQGHLVLATKGGLSGQSLQGLIKINRLALSYLSTGVVPSEVRRCKPLKVSKAKVLEKPNREELQKIKIYLLRKKEKEEGELTLLLKLLEQAEI